MFHVKQLAFNVERRKGASMASIQATFWTFAKRENSTKAPTDGGVAQSIVLKDATDLLNPVIELHLAEAFRYNYCYIDFTGRYYFIKSFDSIAKDTYTLYLECDVLATWISEVRGQNVYAAMSSYGYDDSIDDSRIVPVNDDMEISWNAPAMLTGLTGNIPYQFLSVITDDGLLSGVDIYYAGASSGRIGDFIQNLSNLQFWEDLATRVSGVNAYDSLNELYYLPFIPEFCHDTTDSHWASVFGKQFRGYSCISSPNVIPRDGEIEIRKPAFNDFRYCDKYVKYYLQVPYIGVISVPTDLCRKASKLTFDYCLDCISGTLTIAPRVAGVLLGIFSTCLKASLGIARQHKQGSAIMQTGIQAMTGGALSGAMLGGVSGAIAGAAGGLMVAGAQSVLTMPSFDRVGSNSGSLAPLGLTNEQGVQLYCVEAASNIQPSALAAIAGRPTEKVVTIQNGYIQTHGASVSFAGSPDEIRQFNNLLNGGIYVE